jgi:peptidyl-prolyl cis-trans isomerase SurA
MIKKLKVISVFTLIFFNFVNLFANTDVKIVAKINNEIITSIDLSKEIEYLKLLNADLEKLSENQIKIIAKNSLINQKIKNNEIKKFLNTNNDSPVIENFFKDLYLRLNYKNQNEFEKSLEQKKTYSVSEVKKKIANEIFWNDLILIKFNNQIKVDNEKITEQVERNIKKTESKEYFLSEIVFKKDNNKSIIETKQSIIESINNVGFENTANIFSISDTSKFGGKIGWVNENNLNNIIIEKIRVLKNNEISEIIQIGNNFLILKKTEERIKETSFDSKQLFEKYFEIERKKQLDRMSKIFFNKVKIDYTINEL